MNNPKTKQPTNMGQQHSTDRLPVTCQSQQNGTLQTTAEVLFIMRFPSPNTCVAMKTVSGKSVCAIVRRTLSQKEKDFLRENIHIITKENDVWVINM